MICPQCDGAQRILQVCLHCESGQVDCNYCYNRPADKRNCPQCKGRGRRTCRECKGKGEAIRVCRTCGGSGKLIIPEQASSESNLNVTKTQAVTPMTSSNRSKSLGRTTSERQYPRETRQPLDQEKIFFGIRNAFFVVIVGVLGYKFYVFVQDRAHATSQPVPPPIVVTTKSQPKPRAHRKASAHQIVKQNTHTSTVAAKPTQSTVQPSENRLGQPLSKQSTPPDAEADKSHPTLRGESGPNTATTEESADPKSEHPSLHSGGRLGG